MSSEVFIGAGSLGLTGSATFISDTGLYSGNVYISLIGDAGGTNNNNTYTGSTVLTVNGSSTNTNNNNVYVGTGNNSVSGKGGYFKDGCDAPCDNCYPLTGMQSSGGCGCDCDRCRRCCGTNLCYSLTFAYRVSISGHDCDASPSPFSLEEQERNNPYNVFFRKFKLYEEKKNVFRRNINPFNHPKYDFLKINKKYFQQNNFNFDSKYFFYKKNNKNKWFYLKKKQYADFYHKKEKLNYFYWNGNSWITVKNYKKINFKKINNTKPFFLIFDNDLNIIQTNGDLNFISNNLKLILEKNPEKSFYIDKNLNKKNKIISNKFVGQQSLNTPFGSCDCTPRCYYVYITVTRGGGGGCGFCRTRPTTDRLTFRTVGGGCQNIQPYSDMYFDCFSQNDGYCLKSYYSGDSESVFPFPINSQCGIVCSALAIQAGIIASCPYCKNPDMFPPIPTYDKRLKTKEIFEKNRKLRRIK